MPRGGALNDVFVSYGRADRDRVGALVRVLTDRGLTIFVDESGVRDFQSISETITSELARSKVLLAFYSAAYPRRRACQVELTAAYLAGQREGDPRRRILVLNPEPRPDHIEPIELRDARSWPLPGTPAELDLFADRVAEHLAAIGGPMSSVAWQQPPLWLPAPGRTGSARFTGRLAELWRIHSALHPASLVSATTRRFAQVRGMPGIGKTLLAEEYALRFGAAFPGGVFWLTAASYLTDLRVIAAALDVPGDSPETLFSGLARAITEPSLWIFDDVPADFADVRLLRAPNPAGATLWTTRTLGYGSLAASVDLGPLPDEEALALLTARRPARDPAELRAARAIVDDLGGHPLALDRTAAGAEVERYEAVRHALHDPAHDELALRLVPDGLTTIARDVLRVAALRHPSPVRLALLAEVLAMDTSPEVAARAAKAGLSTLLDACLLTGDGESWSPNATTARDALRDDPDPVRLELLRRRLASTLGHPEREGATMAVLPGEMERMAAFDLQVELATRVGLQPLPDGEGSLREALSSLYVVFQTARNVLRTYGPPISAVHTIAEDLLNHILRPFLNRWHAALTLHEGTRPPQTSPAHHETTWPQAPNLRQELAALQPPLQTITRRLSDLSGSPLGLP